MLYLDRAGNFLHAVYNIFTSAMICIISLMFRSFVVDGIGYQNTFFKLNLMVNDSHEPKSIYFISSFSYIKEL